MTRPRPSSLATLALLLALAATPATRPVAVGPLLTQLGAADFADRERAQRSLTALGPAALADVEQLAKTSDDPEVRSRAAAVAGAIRQGAKYGQTRVTLHVKNVNPRAAFDALAAAAGATLSYDPADRFQAKEQQPVSLDADAEPFWSAFLRLCADAGGELREWGDDGRLVLHPADPGPAFPASFDGPFAVQARWLQAVSDHTVQLGDGDRRGRTLLTLRLQFYVEPKVFLAGVADRPTVTEATDDRGHSLIPPGNPDAGRIAARTGITWWRDLQLDPAAAAGAASIKTVRGTFRVEIAAETAALSIANPAAGLTAEAAGLKLTVDRLDAQGTEVGLDLTVLHPKGDPTAQDLVEFVGLYDAAGRRLARTDLNRDEADGTLTARLHYRADPGVGPPAKLLWTLPTAKRTVEIPFEFHDLPLP